VLKINNFVETHCLKSSVLYEPVMTIFEQKSSFLLTEKNPFLVVLEKRRQWLDKESSPRTTA
jgi:hypothetical protein